MSDRPQQNSSGRGSRASSISVVAGREDVQGTDQPIAYASFRVIATTTNPWCLRGFLGMPEDSNPPHAEYDRARGARVRSSLIRISASPLRSGSMFAPAAAKWRDADLGAQPMDF
jgi:hypothetical protein